VSANHRRGGVGVSQSQEGIQASRRTFCADDASLPDDAFLLDDAEEDAAAFRPSAPCMRISCQKSHPIGQM
jgi:hypothetical protein